MPDNRILQRMLDRLYASMMNGPSLNCRPHSSRQRTDLDALAALRDVAAASILPQLLSESRRCRIAATVPMPPELVNDKSVIVPDDDDDAADNGKTADETGANESKQAILAWRRQKSLLTKLRSLSDDARTYMQDTGVHALHIGYPILSLPPGSIGNGPRRILAPVAFIPTTLEVNTGRRAGVELACHGQGIDLVTPNPALMAWLERESGRNIDNLFDDEEGEQPWLEIQQLIEEVCRLLELNIEDGQALWSPQAHVIEMIPRAEALNAEPAILPSAVLGLFPASNQGLLRDMRAMISMPQLDGPVQSFIDVNANLDTFDFAEHDVPDAEQTLECKARQFSHERLIAMADPCQAQTVEMAREHPALVVHGPPGTGKSQTITNIISDYLARGLRVLFVCDKRTALDVVAHRLDHVGLAGLCAVVHDPQRDQRDFYMSLRNRLDNLTNIQLNTRAEKQLAKVDEALQQIHDELTTCHHALMGPNDQQDSFHTLIGRWLSLPAHDIDGFDEAALREATLDELRRHEADLHILFDRSQQASYARNLWVQALGISLDAFLNQSIESFRRALASCVEDGRVADGTLHETIPPFTAERSLANQAAARQDIAEKLTWITNHTDGHVRQRVAALDDTQIKRMSQMLADAATRRATLAQGPLDRELLLAVSDSRPGMKQINEQIMDLQRYLDIADRWYAFIMFGVNAAATRVLRSFGQARTIDNARRVYQFLNALKARILLTELHHQLTGSEAPSSAALTLVEDQTLATSLEQYDHCVEALLAATAQEGLAQRCRDALADDDARRSFIHGLEQSSPRAEALQSLEQSLQSLGLLEPAWLGRFNARIREGHQAGPTLQRMEQQFDTIESILRIHAALTQLPHVLRKPINALLAAHIAPDQAMAALQRGVMAGELSRRIAADDTLRQIDPQRMNHLMQRYQELEAQKRSLVCQAILFQWVSRQQDRLLVGTGSRLNGLGADLRRRLFVRGKRAMRLRQVIAVGDSIEGGDPLFDMCPVWMASPETVAQIFSRQPLFDVVIFDEASQCRLEEALPVLTRAHRVVIAGDPRQLPPTRFFESAIVSSQQDELETHEDLFEAQQGEVEDLLSAALNLQVQESYLDVHYRSRNADLIEFSNQQFYHNRLQAIPGHPSNRTRYAPLTLYHAEGIYDERCNPIEAQRVCDIVRDLLKRADPPSIGVACFNLKQRDLILAMLDDMAMNDSDFASQLANARVRQGEGSFEGLFVKNLENVQGDERDHIIISTTYGPNKEGRFYRRFGPLGRAGGGRRLNVLVTRARQEVHLVTSIPRQVYQSTEAVPEGLTPTGGWLLFAYLRFAETLAELYEQNHRILEQSNEQRAAHVNQIMIEPYSDFAHALGGQLCEQRRIGSDVHWGNTGFCVDLALHHPQRAEDVTLGVLCDFSRFPHAADPVEWDLFRTGILQWQGWTLHRVWTPHFFRDPQRTVNQIEQGATELVQQESDQSRT